MWPSSPRPRWTTSKRSGSAAPYRRAAARRSPAVTGIGRTRHGSGQASSCPALRASSPSGATRSSTCQTADVAPRHVRSSERPDHRRRRAPTTQRDRRLATTPERVPQPPSDPDRRPLGCFVRRGCPSDPIVTSESDRRRTTSGRSVAPWIATSSEASRPPSWRTCSGAAHDLLEAALGLDRVRDDRLAGRHALR